MVRFVAATTVSLVAGIVLGAWMLGRDTTAVEASNADPDKAYLGSSLPFEQQLLRLEQIIAEERDARMVLEDQLGALMDEIERIDSAGPRAFSERAASVEASRAERRDRTTARSADGFASAVQRFQQRRLGMLIDGGFSDDEARQIMRHESEAQYLAMQQAHDAQRRGEAPDFLAATQDSQSALRNQLGDSDYEKYLAAQGQPTAVQVLQVLESSPGSHAGLQPGDQIVSYNGERVFDVNDLRALTLQGTVGEEVVIEIERDGMRMQLSLPRGPVGISGPRAGMRNINWWGGT